MNNLSNERLKAIAGLGSPECMALPPSHDQCAAMAREILAYREAQGNVIAWIHEDELPESYPYDQMFPYSKVDVVRMFPVYVHQHQSQRLSHE